MMNRKLWIWIFSFIFTVALITGCRGSKDKSSTVKATAIPEPEAGQTTVTGKIFSTTLNQPYPKAAVWLAQVYREGEDSAYVLDAASSPAEYADENGVFVIANVEPTEYVIVVGDPETEYVVIPADTGRARIWATEAGKILDVGQLNVSLSPKTP
jgi:hypothetical protein